MWHRTASLWAAAMAAALLLGLAPPSRAAWPVNPAVNVPVCTATGAQLAYLSTVPDGSGGVIVAWPDERSGLYDVYAQHLLAGGYADPAWPANGRGVITLAADQYSPQLVADGYGGAIVLWADDRAGSSAADLYAHHLRANGTLDPAWPTNGRLLSSGTGTQREPNCIANGSGGLIVSWRENRGATGEDIYVQMVTSTGTISWGASGLLVCGAVGAQYGPVLASDLAGGAVVAWYDYRKATGNDYDIYATRVLANGTLDARWTANGVALCTAPNFQQYAAILSDGTGGAFVSWSDARSGVTADLYATRVREGGSLDPSWPANGQLVHGGGGNTAPVLLADAATGFLVVSVDSTYSVKHVYATGGLDPGWPSGGVHLPSVLVGELAAVPDQAGGAILVFEDHRANPSYSDIAAHHIRWDGVLDPAWPAPGRMLCNVPLVVNAFPAVASDGAGGAIAAWIDGRDYATTNYDVYAQRVRSDGALGIPEPRITHAQDIRGDQGGKLLLAWSASEGDEAPNPYVSRYHVWRRIEVAAGTPLAAATRSRAPGEAPRPGDVRADTDAAGATWWEFVATVPASLQPYYALTVATTSDSLPGWIPWNVFVVDAEDNTTWAFYSSPADSGYSADNLAPPLTAPAFGQYASGVARIWWPPSPAADFKEFRVYRSPVLDFAPGPENFVAALRDTEYHDLPGAPSVYIVHAVDVHGNAGPNGLIVPDGVLDAGGPAPPRAVAFHGARPNPARGAAEFAFDLPAPAAVRLEVFDVSGRCVRKLEASLPAGSHRLAWDARDGAGGAAAPGLYLARFEARGYARVARFVLMR